MKRTFLLTVLGMAMALTTSAQIKQDAGGMKFLKQTLTYNDSTYKAPAKGEAAIAELLGCPDGTVFGGEYKDEDNVWSGFTTADEGRKDMAASFYQHFSDCYYSFHGVRFLGMFNYFDEENVEWKYCNERGGINEKGEMTKSVKIKVAFYKDDEDELPGELVYSKVFDLIGERTNVKLGDNRSGYSFVYAFDVDLGEEIKLEHGFMQINAIDEHDETIDCYLALFTASSSTGYGLVKMDMRDGNEPSWMGQLPICFCFKGDGSFISDKALKFNRLLSPGSTDASPFGKVQVELRNIGGDYLDNTTLQLWQDGKLLATEKVNSNIEPLDAYKYTFNARVNCSEPGTHHVVVKNVTPNSDMIAADTIAVDVMVGDGKTYPASGSTDGYFYIQRVQIGDIDNESGESSYTDYTDQKTEIRPGQELTLVVDPTSQTPLAAAWIDWNNNGVFENTEALVFPNYGYTATVKIPENADVKPGEKRLRVVLSYEDPAPAGFYTYGETEDYTLVVKGNEGAPAIGLDAKAVCLKTEQDSKSTAIDLTNEGAETLTADIDFSYILPNAPTSNYAMNKVSVPQGMKAPVVKKVTPAKAAKAPEQDNDTQYVLRYDQGQYATIGLSANDSATFATYYPGEMLSSLKGMKISSIDVYVGGVAKENSIVIYGEKDQNHNGDLLAEKKFTPQGDAWNHIELDEPIVIGDQDLWIGYKTKGMKTGEYNIGIDGTDGEKGVIGFGDLINIGQNIWWSMGDLGMKYNYCLRANVTGQRTPAIDWLSVDTKHLEVASGKGGKLNVSVDGSKLDNAIYEAKIEIRTNDDLRSVVTIPVYVINGKCTGIISKQYTGGANVRVSGHDLAVSSDKDIDRIQIFDLSGRLTETLSIGGRNYNATLTGVSGALYILKVVYADGTSSTIKVPVI